MFFMINLALNDVINSNNHFAIYGPGIIGKIFLEYLLSKKKSSLFFSKKVSLEMSYCGCPILTLNKNTYPNFSMDVTVLICLDAYDAVLVNNIRFMIRRHGFKNVVIIEIKYYSALLREDENFLISRPLVKNKLMECELKNK